MTHSINYDVFNGDADGICALHQFRLAQPNASTLITGVKRNIQLLDKVPYNKENRINVFDISLDKNRAALTQHLDTGASINYFDHHFAGDIPHHKQLNAYINTSAETCTSLIVNHHLAHQHYKWAIVGAFGDNFDNSAITLSKQRNDLNSSMLSKLKQLGILLNYNAYGAELDDLHIAPISLYKKIACFVDPLEFITTEPVFEMLVDGYDEDITKAKSLEPIVNKDKYAVYLLPNEKWARRASGVFANRLNIQYPGRAHALLTDIGEQSWLVSVRAPAENKTGADELCRQFSTGGGRKAAAGINKLAHSDYDNFISKLIDQ